MRTHGMLVKWNDERGFGFVAVASGSEEVFVHVSAFPRDGQRPRVGEIVSFEIQVGADGKRKAVRLRRPTGRAPVHAAGGKPAGTISTVLGAVAGVAVVVAIVHGAVSGWAPAEPVTQEALAPTPLARPIEAGGTFVCDGRTHCSQMRSCAEATYVQKNCPNAQMDGDNDGEPCEDHWCK